DDLTRIPFATDGGSADRFCVGPLNPLEAYLPPIRVRNGAGLLLPASCNFLLGEIGRRWDVAKRNKLLAARDRGDDQRVQSDRERRSRSHAHQVCAGACHGCLSRNSLTRGAQIRTASGESIRKWPSSPKSGSR